MMLPRQPFVVLLLIITLIGLGNAYTGSVKGEEPNIQNRVRLVLPQVIYAVPGIEMNVYYDNVVLVLNTASYAFDVNCPKGVQLHERWSYMPEDKDVGEYPFALDVRDENNHLVASARSKVLVVPKDAGHGKEITVLCVGASWTDYSVYPQHLFDLFDREGNPKLTMIGSRGPDNKPPAGKIKHEGYSGWTAEAFATIWGPKSRLGYLKSGETGSPFLYQDADGKPKLDFAQYCKQFSEGKAPDFVTINLGPNETFSATDENIDGRIDTMLKYYDTLIEMFHRFDKNIKIGASLVPPPSVSQDGFRNYIGAGKQTRWQYRRNQHRIVERMLKHYGGRENEHIYLMPLYINLDCVSHYPTWVSPRNAQSPEKVTRVNNGTHPSPEGYRQFGDTIYCWMKACLN
jgi:hypothetical protein